MQGRAPGFGRRLRTPPSQLNRSLRPDGSEPPSIHARSPSSSTCPAACRSLDIARATGRQAAQYRHACTRPINVAERHIAAPDVALRYSLRRGDSDPPGNRQTRSPVEPTDPHRRTLDKPPDDAARAPHLGPYRAHDNRAVDREPITDGGRVMWGLNRRRATTVRRRCSATGCVSDRDYRVSSNRSHGHQCRRSQTFAQASCATNRPLGWESFRTTHVRQASSGHLILVTPRCGVRIAWSCEKPDSSGGAVLSGE
jgi:hypothetical protein